MNKDEQNTNEKHNKIIIIIHWVTSVLIVLLFLMGKYMEELDFSKKNELLKIHVAIGLLVFNLTILRVYFYFKYPRPGALKRGSKLNSQIVVWVNKTFYILLLGASITGIVSLFLGGYIKAMKLVYVNKHISLENYTNVPLKGHGILAGILMVLFAAHVIGVIKHYLITKENTLKRIT